MKWKMLVQAVAVCTVGLIGCGPVEPSEQGAVGAPETLVEGGDRPVTSSATIDLLPYILPNCSAASTQWRTQTGGTRWTIPMGYDGSGRKQFITVKSQNGKDYESYTADGSWIRIWKDTSWAYLNPNNNADYCDEQCGVLGQPTTCKHEWANDPAEYAYQAPKDTGDWGGAKILPRYFNADGGVYTYQFNLYIDAQSETTCGACDSWHEGSTWQQYTLQYLASVTSPTGITYTNVIKKVITGGAGTNEVTYYAKGYGFVGFEVIGSTYKDWISGTTSGVSWPTICMGGSSSTVC